MQSIKETISRSKILRNGVVGLISGIGLFVPCAFMAHYLWMFVYSEFLNRSVNTNTDSYLVAYFCCPITMAISALSGIFGGAFGLKLNRSETGELVGSILGGVLGGLIIATLMTHTVVREWAT